MCLEITADAAKCDEQLETNSKKERETRQLEKQERRGVKEGSCERGSSLRSPGAISPASLRGLSPSADLSGRDYFCRLHAIMEQLSTQESTLSSLHRHWFLRSLSLLPHCRPKWRNHRVSLLIRRHRPVREGGLIEDNLISMTHWSLYI